MPIHKKYQIDFCESGTYHVFNRANNKDKLFLTDDNHRFFLKKYDEYLSPYLETFAWCLIPNHFHLVVRVRTIEEITKTLTHMNPRTLSITERKFGKGEITLSELIEQAFKKFFQSYSQSFNNAYKRKGSLFHKPFKRVKIDKESYFTQVIIYVHANAVKHGIISDFTKWKWSSWESYVSNAPTKLMREEVLLWFGGLSEFIRIHREMAKYYYDGDMGVISLED
jgi:putative transposase